MAIRGFRVASACIVVAGFASGALLRAASATVRPSAGTTITVNTTADDNTNDGNCSLREALQAANTDTAVDACPAGNGADTIVLGAHTYPITHGTMVATQDVTILGPNSAARVSASGATPCSHTCVRTFIVRPSVHVTMSHIEIENAATAIYNQGTLDLDNSILTSENANCSGYFGNAAGVDNAGTARLASVQIAGTPVAIYNAPNENLTADRLDMTGNGGCGGVFTGRARSIENDGTMTITNSTFNNDLSGGAAATSVRNRGTLAIDHSRFDDNDAAKGFAVFTNYGHATITESAFDRNASLPIFTDIGSLALVNSRISSNPGNPDDTSPGALWNDGGTLLTITGSTIDHNVGTFDGTITTGGGFVNDAFVNDTITDNVTVNAAPPGPLDSHDFPSGGVTNGGILLIRNTTIARNRVVGYHDWHYRAGGIVTFGGFTALSNSIVADNVGDFPVRSQDCYGPIHSLGYNLIDDRTGCDAGTANNVFGVSAHLYPLADNGGPTMTSLPRWDSPEVDSANPATPADGDATTCEQLDQRGVSRPRDGNADGSSRCDMGAVER